MKEILESAFKFSSMETVKFYGLIPIFTSALLDDFDTNVIISRTSDGSMDEPTDPILATTWLITNTRVAPY